MKTPFKPVSDSMLQRERELIAAARAAAVESPILDLTRAIAHGGSRVGLADDAPLPVDSIAGYEIVREIHRGAQGVVYQAVQKSTRRQVAVKVMKVGPFVGPADRARFEREVQVLAQLSHPNIVTIHDSGQAAGSHYFVMDYISGRSLDDYMQAGGPVAAATGRRSARRGADGVVESLRLFVKICGAVNAAHLRGIMHRDLKPSNIRVDPAGEPHVLDFGLAKMTIGDLIDETYAGPLSMTGQFIGSLPWASPEQAEGVSARIDVRTDVYSLGVILYQMLTGRFPYRVAGAMRETLENIVKAAPIPPSTIRKEIDDEVETIVLKCLSKERERRYQSAGELARDIERYIAGEPIEAKRDSMGYMLKKQLHRYRLPAAIAACFALLVLFGFVVSARGWAQAETEVQKLQVIQRFFDELLSAGDPSLHRSKPVDMRGVLDGVANRVAEGPLSGQPEIQASMRTIIGSLYWSMGNTAKAESHLRDALRIGRTVEPTNRLDMARTTCILGGVLVTQHRVDEAEQLFREGMEIKRRVLGTNDPEVATGLHNFADWLRECGKPADAEPLFREALDIRRRILPPADPETLTTVIALGDLLASRGKFAEAEPLHREGLAYRRATLPPDDIYLAASFQSLGADLVELERSAEAEPLLRECLSIREKVLGRDERRTLNTKCLLGGALAGLGRFDEAEALLLDGYRMEDFPNARPHQVQWAVARLVKLYEDWGQPQKADQWRQLLNVPLATPAP